MFDTKKKFYIGRIVAAHGIKGEFKVKIDEQYASYITNCFSKINFLSKDETLLKLTFKKKTDKFFIVSMAGINNRTLAESYSKTAIYCNVTELPKLDSDEFYQSDLISKKIVDLEENKIGTVSNMFNFGAGDIIEIETLDGKREMYPFLKAIFPEVGQDYIRFVPHKGVVN